MGLKLHLNDMDNIVYESGKTEYKVDNVGIQDIDIEFNYKSASGLFKEIILPNYTISYGNSYFSEKTTLLFQFDKETVEMHFAIQGASLTSINKMKDEYTIESNTHNIFYCNNIKGEVAYAKQLNIFEINLQPSFFEQYLPNDDIFKNFKKVIKNKELGYLNDCNYPITPKMHLVIQEIINCSWVNEYRQLFLDSKVLELLLLQMHQINTFSFSTLNRKTSSTIIDKMHDVKDIILEKIDNTMSLSDLAREVNTNKATLKKEFKNVFGTTVFGYIKGLKMEEAKKMLLEQNLSVSEVSDRIGYKNPQHFSTAFKRKFGVSPSMAEQI